MISRRRRRRHCRHCGCLFLPDRRSKGKQRYCSSETCQKERRNVNIRDWYERNPDCLEYQRGLTRQWFKSHPDYSLTRRLKNPALRKENLLKTRRRMRVLCRRELFDKTNSILTQLNKRQEDKCILTELSHLTTLQQLARSPSQCSRPLHLDSTDYEREWSGASIKGEGQALIGLTWGCPGGIHSAISFHDIKLSSVAIHHWVWPKEVSSEEGCSSSFYSFPSSKPLPSLRPTRCLPCHEWGHYPTFRWPAGKPEMSRCPGYGSSRQGSQSRV